MDNEEKNRPQNFIEEIIEDDLKEGRNGSAVHTRFPPEPNGYLHIGHAKSICLNFGLAAKYGGRCNLRFDDTNPEKEEVEYVDSIMEDVRWLGFQWHDRPYYASDYFGRLYDWALLLIQKGLAYVCDMSAEEIAATRGTPTEPGKTSPWRDRTVEENLDLFERMKNGEFPDGSKVLRAKIGMDSPNMHMRDPVLYRIKRAEHHRTGNDWCIYPMYDFAHGQSDYIEGITHSICTLEFEVHRPLYDWFLDHIAEPGKVRPRQIEFARLNLSYTVMSKRLLLRLVKEGHVRGWDDPRMPTISGLRRRGCTPESIRAFASIIGVAKRDAVVDMALLEHCIREDLNRRSPRVMGVLNPLKLVIENYPEDRADEFEIANNPEDPAAGSRRVPFSRVLYIEREDFMEEPPRGFFRLAPGREVRLRGACLVTCTGVVKDERGEITELRCAWDPASLGGNAPDGRKVKGTLHWVSAAHAVKAEVRLYDRLFTKEDPYEAEEGKDFLSNINPDSLKTVTGYIEPHAATARPGNRFQFERLGYFCVDPDAAEGRLVFNRTITLKDSWAREAKKG
ncbi:MAG: glutamine--tRNA ligase/YqeY domain fusion protein [Spirochaetes bacterium]|jgi:glutaminyl-tRNA synthetase|nr:glutamine--tRNA ligase/YqeY domain fusion protein [Spirochaetota bacterium]